MHPTKAKITLGYSLLLAILLSSLIFIHQEVERLTTSDGQQSLVTDSLLMLLREKDRNTIQMLRVLNEANDKLLSTNEIEEIIAKQDSVVTQQRVQHRVVTKRDSLVTKTEKKRFFKRLAEAFSPAKEDTEVWVNTSTEFATDTIVEAYNPVDSLHQKIVAVSDEKRSKKRATGQRRNVQFHRKDTQLTARIDSLMKEYERNLLQRAQADAEREQQVRIRSARMIGGIAGGALLLSAVFLILIWRDITRSHRYRRELEEANRRAEELLVTREKLMLAITHDFKAPLGSIMGYTELLARLTKDERQRFYLDNMKSSSQHLLKLVSDLLEFHRLDLNKAEVNRVAFNPLQLFEEIHVSFEPLAVTKALTLDCNITPQLNDRFVSDPLRIRQIVNNLLSNAVKFTLKGSVALRVSYASSQLTIEVTDTGKGMDASDSERIYQEFTRLPGAQGEEGFGLGLSIVHKLVTLLEGSIRVQSVLGEGTTFAVVLPLYPVGHSAFARTDPTVSMPVSPIYQLPKETVPDRILLIDDDKIQLSLTAAMLEQQHIEAICCEQMDELLEQLSLHTFDVLLTDVQMPGMNGFDLLKLLRASNIPQAKTLPVIAVTARGDVSEEAFREHGFVGCLRKPFTVAELFAILGIDSRPVESPLCEGTLCFENLTAFSGDDDAQAGRTILVTFVDETRKNIQQMEKALSESDSEEIVGMAHKLLPLFILIRATDALPLLTWLEARRGTDFSDDVKQKTEQVLPLLHRVVEEAKNYLAGL